MLAIEITESANQFLNELVAKQDEPGLGLRLRVTAAGTPAANCELIFCGNGESQADDQLMPIGEINLFIEQASQDWLVDAEIDYINEGTGGRLNIRAPKIKGSAPATNAPLLEQVGWLIDTEINPSLASHKGHVTLVGVTEDGVVSLQFGGGCQGCGMANVTLQNGIEKTLKEQLPEVTAVIDATDHASGQNPYY